MRMKPVVIEAFDIPSAWFKVVAACMEKGYERPVFRGARSEQKRKELDFLFLNIRLPQNRPLVPDVPEGVPPPTSMEYVNRYVEYVATPFKQPWEDYTYGERMLGADKIEGQRASSLDINQLERITQMLKETPETNRAIIEIGSPTDLLLEHPTCLRLLHFKVRYKELHLAAYFRSWDAWAGLPNNLAAYQLLKESLVKELNEGGIEVVDGEIFASSLGTHVYSGQWKYAEMLVRKK